MKQRIRRLAIIAAVVLGAHVVEVFWLIKPSFFPDGLHVHWLDAVVVLGLGGAWFAGFCFNLKRAALLPQNDPRIENSTPELAHAK
jgi:hypothetical protein